MYIDRRWDIPEIIFVKLLPRSDPELTTTISRSIRFPTEIEDDIKKAIINYCRKCPVSKLLKIIL
jgi:putative redox protein